MDVVGQTAPEETQPSPVTDGLVPPEWLPDLVPTFLFQFVLAVVVVIAAYYLAKISRQLLGRRVARRFKRPSVSRTILRVMQIGIVGSAVVLGLGFMGLGIGNLALSVGVFSAVVGIILAPIIGSVLSGVFVLTEQPYEVGDMIEIEETETTAFVEDITLLYTKVFTLDNTFMVLPNGEMRQRDVINYSAEDTRTRLTADVAVTYESNIPEARRLLESAARNADGVITGGPDIRIGSARYPASPTCYIREYADHGVTLRLRYWAKDPYKLTATRSRVLTNAWERLAEADVKIPYPHSHLVFDETSGSMQVSIGEEDVEETVVGGETPATDGSSADTVRTAGSEPERERVADDTSESSG
ncbi:MAG: mechanosensitive ion channel family protein [Natronomonas sp.]